MDKYQEFIKTRKIKVLSNQQVAESSAKYVAEDLQNLITVFGKVYCHFKYSDANMKAEQAHSEHGEADLMDLRLSIQTMFYTARGRIDFCNIAERKMISVAMQYIVSIFVNIPNLCMDITKDEIIDFIDKHNLL